MRYLLSVVLLLLCTHSFGQKPDLDDSFVQSLDLFYGQKFFHSTSLNATVGDVNEMNFGIPISFVGISITSVLVWNRRFSYPCTMGFHHVLPQKIDLNDSISGRVSGFNFHLPLAGYDLFRRSKSIDLVLGAGFNTGRIRLFGDSRLEQVNAYFAPFVSISPRLTLGRLSFQFRAEYELDITRSKWRNVWFSNSPKINLGPMRSTGLSTSVSLGWVLGDGRK